MMSFRTRITLWYALLTFVLSVAMLTGSLAAVHSRTRQTAKRQLAALADGIKTSLDAAGADSVALEAAMREVNEKLIFTSSRDAVDLAYALYGADGKAQYKFSESPNEPFADIGPGERGSYFFERWANHRECTFYRWLKGERHDILVAATHHVKFMGDILLGYLLMLPIAVLLSIVAGRLMARRVVRPLESMAAAARRIQEGDLGARVETGGSDAEPRYVAGVLNSAFAELDRAFERINQFSSDIAHQLKTPLTAMRGTMEVALRRERTQEEYQSTMAQCVEDIAEITRVIDGLLMLARPGAASDKKLFAPVRVAEAVHGACAGLEELSAERRVTVEIVESAEPVVAGNRVFMGQLFFNLLHNAIKYSPADSTVRVEISIAGGMAVITVADNGAGIPPQELELVFDRAYRGGGSNEGGHGLGLAIVKWILELHGGDVKVESAAGSGATFTVRLPLAPGGS